MHAFPLALAGLQRAASRIGAYQCLNHSRDANKDCVFARWATGEIPGDFDLKWWEVAAAAGSSLTVFALMLIVARGAVFGEQVRDVEHAYFPWIGSLHTLLDSLIDRPEDVKAEQRSLLDHYQSDDEAIARLEMLATRAVDQARPLCNGDDHVLILAAMTGFYLSAITAGDELAQSARSQILARLGHRATLAIMVLRAKHVVGKLVSTLRASAAT
jgi:tetraprenyl-beta-curcumene synthase